MDAQTDRPALIASVGGGLATLGALLPWAGTASAQYGFETFGLLTGAIGVIAMTIAVLQEGSTAAVALVVAGAVVSGVGFWQLGAVTSTAVPGVGLFLTAIAGSLIAYGGGVRLVDVSDTLPTVDRSQPR